MFFWFSVFNFFVSACKVLVFYHLFSLSLSLSLFFTNFFLMRDRGSKHHRSSFIENSSVTTSVLHRLYPPTPSTPPSKRNGYHFGSLMEQGVPFTFFSLFFVPCVAWTHCLVPSLHIDLTWLFCVLKKKSTKLKGLRLNKRKLKRVSVCVCLNEFLVDDFFLFVVACWWCPQFLQDLYLIDLIDRFVLFVFPSQEKKKGPSFAWSRGCLLPFFCCCSTFSTSQYNLLVRVCFFSVFF